MTRCGNDGKMILIDGIRNSVVLLNKIINKGDVFMNELATKGINMNHVELCELINKLRKEEGNRKEVSTDNLLKKIRKEVETMKSLGLEGAVNFYGATYLDKQGKERSTYEMNRDGILQIASSESVYVRAKIIEYINALESKLKEQDQKKDLLLAIYDGGQNAILASKQLTELEVKEATTQLLNKIEEDKPLVEFAEQVSLSTDAIDIGTFSKLIKDENIKLGRNQLFEWLRDNKYLMKNNIPYQQYIDNGYFKVIEQIYKTPYGNKINVKTLITPIGQIKLIEKLRKLYGDN